MSPLLTLIYISPQKTLTILWRQGFLFAFETNCDIIKTEAVYGFNFIKDMCYNIQRRRFRKGEIYELVEQHSQLAK